MEPERKPQQQQLLLLLLQRVAERAGSRAPNVYLNEH